MNTILLSNVLAEAFGSSIAMYLLIRLIEWAVVKRVIKNYNISTFLSSLIAFILCYMSATNLAEINHERTPGAKIVIYFISASFITVARIFWRKYHSAKTDNKAVEVV